jgi:hypothetical protein
MNIPCEIKAASIDKGMLTLEFTPWQGTTTSVRIPVATPDPATRMAGQKLLSGICRKLGIVRLADSAVLVGRTLTLKLAQPKVAAGIHSAPVVVEVETC